MFGLLKPTETLGVARYALGRVKAWVQNLMQTGIENLVYMLCSTTEFSGLMKIVMNIIIVEKCFHFLYLGIRKFAKHKPPFYDETL